MPTAQQIENTRMAYSIMAGIPAEKVNLDVVRGGLGIWANVSRERLIKDCGTVGCIAGWLSAHPYFIAQGLRYSSTRAMGLSDLSNRLFGSCFLFDGSLTNQPGKTEALKRLRKHLVGSGAITSERNAELAREESRLAA